MVTVILMFWDCHPTLDGWRGSGAGKSGVDLPRRTVASYGREILLNETDAWRKANITASDEGVLLA